MAQELEMKILVDAVEFSRCLSCMRRHTQTPGDTYVQVNYYFDTKDLSLASAHAMLRVRRKRDALFLQYKSKREQTGALFLCEEKEQKIPEFPRKVDPSLFFKEAPSEECFLLGDLVTFRTDFIFPQAVVSFDESFYWGKVDLEIEIEGTREAIESLAAFLSPKGEVQKGNGKFSRFLEEYKNYYG